MITKTQYLTLPEFLLKGNFKTRVHLAINQTKIYELENQLQIELSHLLGPNALTAIVLHHCSLRQAR